MGDVQRFAVVVLCSMLLGQGWTSWSHAAADPGAESAKPGAAAGADAGQKSPYRVGPGDALDVVVWKNPDVSRKVAIRPDGRITLPLIGELVVEGLTTEEMTQLITERLKEYFSDPVVTVSLEGINATRAPRMGSKPSAEAAQATAGREAGDQGPTKPPYRIGAGDALEVVVWKNPDVSRKVGVRPDGRITLPLIGDVFVEGLSTEETTRILTEKLKEYFSDPVVTVSLEGINQTRLLRVGPAQSTEPGEGEKAPYLVGVEDVLEVNVWKNPDLSRQVWVRSDGRVTLPLAGEIYVLGKTLEQVKEMLQVRLREFVAEPVVSVSLVDANSYTVYLLGMVKAPGAVKLRGPKTLLQILAMTGGFQEFADSSAVAVMRWEKGKQKRIPVNVKKILSKGEQDDLLLAPGDVIVVP